MHRTCLILEVKIIRVIDEVYIRVIKMLIASLTTTFCTGNL